MTNFDLPPQTIVNKVIPKNAFDTVTTARQKKKLAELVERIRWANKLSAETINLSGKDISEIQVFEIELRKPDEVADLLDVFDKAIPYPIVFWVFLNDKVFIRASKKHSHPAQENRTVIDWTFKTEWMNRSAINYAFDLKKSLDHIFYNFCQQLSSGHATTGTLDDLVAFEQQYTQLCSKIDQVKTSIKRATQFNKKVALNLELKKLEDQLSQLRK